MQLLFDIGGTKTRLAATKNKNEIDNERVRIFSTPNSFEEGVDLIVKTAQELTSDEKIEACAGGIGGPLDPGKERIVFDSGKTNLKNWVEKPLKSILTKKLGVDVKLENDSALGALGEAVFGAGKKYSIVAYLTIGTGVGGARVVDKVIDENSLGFEPGKQIVDADGSIYPHADPPVNLEQIISGQAIEKRMGQMPSDIKDEKFWEDMAHYLAIGLNDTAVFWSPNVIILGGSLANYIPLKEIEKVLSSILTTFKKTPPIKKAQLGELSGIYGALRFLNC